MKLEGLHHVTAITADAQRNLDFYVRVLGLRFVKKTVNFDQPDAYHLYYGDESASPGSIMTFFEFPGAARGRAGDGMVHRTVWRVRDASSLEFWAQRLEREGVTSERDENSLVFSDPEGLGLELTIEAADDEPLAAETEGIPAEHALLGFAGVRAFARDPERSRALLEEALGFEGGASGRWSVKGEQRQAFYAYDDPPADGGVQGAGTVHHVAFASSDTDHEGWRERAASAGAHVTPVIDRDYFLSIYFREPSGVLFEIATPSPGFAVDEPADALGEQLRLPGQHEHLRDHLEATLTPLENPRPRSAAR